MIVCHEKKLIFIKTKKTAGTSLEIALSGHCGPGCVITKISKVDEEKRTELGYRPPQNYQGRRLLWDTIRFRKHMRSDQIRSRLSKDIWKNYHKFTIVRNPFDRAISRYFWSRRRGQLADVNFREFFDRFPNTLTENLRIAPLRGRNKLDTYLRYESLEEDLIANDLGFIWESFRELSAKSGHRPKNGATVEEMFNAHPSVVSLIKGKCCEEIEYFGYTSPL